MDRFHFVKHIYSFITPQSLAYDRNHGAIPQISCAKHSIRIDGEVPNSYEVSVKQLATEFAQHEVTCVLSCAGNRRHTMLTMLREVDGIDWGDAAVMNCIWKGPRVRDVLARAGVTHDDKLQRGKKMHACFSSYQVPCQDDSWFGGNVELEKCTDEHGEVILGLEVSNIHAYMVMKLTLEVFVAFVPYL